MDKRKIVVAFFILCLFSFMFGGVETAGSNYIPKILFGLQFLGIFFLGIHSNKKKIITVLLVVAILALAAGNWAKEIRYYGCFAAAYLIGLAYGKKYPSLFLKVFMPYAFLSCFIMLAQTIGLSPLFFLWDNSAWHDETNETVIPLKDRYSFYKKLNLENPLLKKETYFSMTQTRPSGLAYANNLTCSLLVLTLAALFTKNQTVFPRQSYLLSFPLVISGGLLSFLGAWLLACSRFLNAKKQRWACIKFIVWLAVALFLYQLIFPSLAISRQSSGKIVLSFSTRADYFIVLS